MLRTKVALFNLFIEFDRIPYTNEDTVCYCWCCCGQIIGYILSFKCFVTDGDAVTVIIRI